ncbi:hypothetical protein Lal_00022166 [Lupinus albus]|nr:hypothetical protein Lal_00022166 [Lupinus albus]
MLVDKLAQLTTTNSQFPPQPPHMGLNHDLHTLLHMDLAPFQLAELVAFSMNDDALSWYKWMFHTSQLNNWEGFTKALLIRFGPSIFANPKSKLFKLR